MLPVYDWTRTRAFSLPSDQHGWIRINLQGRERAGIVSPEQYGDTCRQLEELMRCLSGEDGRLLVREVIRTANSEEARFSKLPDLVVHWADSALVTPSTVAVLCLTDCLAFSPNEYRGQQQSKTQSPQHASGDGNHRHHLTITCRRPARLDTKTHEMYLGHSDSDSSDQQDNCGEQSENCRTRIFPDKYHRQDHTHQIDDKRRRCISKLLCQE